MAQNGNGGIFGKLIVCGAAVVTVDSPVYAAPSSSHRLLHYCMKLRLDVSNFIFEAHSFAGNKLLMFQG